MSILEIGSGTGELLHELADIGIRRVIGIDPFIQKDIRYSNGAMVLRASIDDLTQYFSNETFDLIMFNHSIEHSTTPIFDLAKVSSFLKQNGEILVRLPVSNSEIARYYGKYWWSLDAPRHIYIFSISSMKMVAMKCGLTVKRIHFEGTIDDFLASEQHKAGIALLSENSYVISKKFSNFNKNQLAQYKKEIEKQNKLGTAALAGFVLGLKN
jgi:SAM-dependent methyltransferase